MLDLNSFNKALKLSWVRKYLNENNSGKWKVLAKFEKVAKNRCEAASGVY